MIRFSVSIEFRVLGFYLKVDYLVKEQAFEYNYILHGEFLSHNLAEAWLIPFLQLAISSCSTGTDNRLILLKKNQTLHFATIRNFVMRASL